MQVATTISSVNNNNDDLVKESMSGVARYIYETAPTFTSAGYILLAVIFILSAIVYHLGFARSNLKLWQNIVIYVFLFLGCIILTFLAFFLPMVEVLIITAIFLSLYKFRLKKDRKTAQ
ncbi:MAG: YlaH-like family protein [Kurthia sp.]|nr:YlaH-like family protein [Candidatus Kurthia equi]